MEVKKINKALASEHGLYEVGFCTQAVGAAELPHAFVLWCKDDEFSKNGLCTSGAGFSPSEEAKKYQAYLGVTGAISDSDRFSTISKMLLVRVNSDIFTATDTYRLAIKNDKGAVYKLFSNDCVDFVKQVAKRIPNLNVPNDGLVNELPDSFISKLMQIND